MEESRATVGDLAETIALLTESAHDAPARQAPEVSLSGWIEERLLPLRAEDEPRQRDAVVEWWRTLPYRESFLVNKFLTGELRVGVSELLVSRALSEVLSMSRPDVARRLMGDWFPSAEFWESLRSGATQPVDDASAAYPFFLASPLEADPATLGDRPGRRGCQIVRHGPGSGAHAVRMVPYTRLQHSRSARGSAARSVPQCCLQTHCRWRDSRPPGS